MKILIIDKDNTVLDTLSDKFLGEGHQVITANEVPSAIRMIYKELPDLILSQNTFTFMEGTELRKIINLQLKKHIPIVFFDSRHLDCVEVSDKDLELSLQHIAPPILSFN